MSPCAGCEDRWVATAVVGRVPSKNFSQRLHGLDNCDRDENPSFSTKSAHSGRRPESKLSGQAQRWPRPPLRPEGSRDAHATRALVAQPGYHSLRIAGRAPAGRQDSNFWPLPSGGSGVGPSAVCTIPLTSCPDSEERTGIRLEKERVYGYSGGAKALLGRPLAPAIAPIRGLRR
jgi:hypothetical protein